MDEWIIDEQLYPINIVKRAIYKNMGKASFFMSFDEVGKFKLLIKKKKKDFDLSLFLDDLNHYNFLEEENKRAQPILDAIFNEIKEKNGQ